MVAPDDPGQLEDRGLDRSALEGHADDPLQSAQMLWALSGKVACKDVDRPKPRITRGNAVVPLGFERGQEACNALDGEIRHVQTVHRATHFPCREAQEKQQRIAIAADRMRT